MFRHFTTLCMKGLNFQGSSKLTLRKKCQYSELFWSTFSRNRTEYGEIQSISPYSVRMRENTDQKILRIWNFSRSGLSHFAKILITESGSQKY